MSKKKARDILLQSVDSTHKFPPLPGNKGYNTRHDAFRLHRNCPPKRCTECSTLRHQLATNTILLSDARFLSFLEKTPNSASEKANARPRGRLHLSDQLTFTWLESPGLLPSGGFTGLLSTRGLTTCRKGLHSGKPLTLIPSKMEE